MKSERFADLVNHYRVFPRLFSLLFILLLWETSLWFMGLSEPNVEQAGFASTMVATTAAFFKFYVQTGKNSKGENTHD